MDGGWWQNLGLGAETVSIGSVRIEAQQDRLARKVSCATALYTAIDSIVSIVTPFNPGAGSVGIQ